jgi:hypothetical protein
MPGVLEHQVRSLVSTVKAVAMLIRSFFYLRIRNVSSTHWPRFHVCLLSTAVGE